jgi:hypothetical protein
MKTKTLLITAAMLLCFSAIASAQAIYSVSSIPVTTVTATGNAELAGSITFTSNQGASTQGTITIAYGGANITTPWTSIGVAGTGTYAAMSNANVNATASSYTSPAQLVINIPAVGGGAGTFTISNVRIQISGTGLTNLVATISATGNQIAAGSTSVTVVNSTTGAGIASVNSYTNAVPFAYTAGVTTTFPTIAAATGTISGTNTSIVVKEGFLSAFVASAGVRITVSATPPKGVTFTFPATVQSYDSTGGTAYHGWVVGAATASTPTWANAVVNSGSTSSSSLQINYYVATDNSGSNAGDTVIEYLEIPVTIAATPASMTFPLSSVTFTYTVSMAPVVGAYNSSGVPYTTPAPRYTALEVGPNNLATITGGTTALLIPYASTLSGFDTALTISNTSKDPGATLLGIANAGAPQTGTVTFYFFPSTPVTTTPTYTTTAGSPGSGLDASGNVVMGATYTVFVSQIAAKTTPALTSFTGYIIVVTNFTNAHGIFVISNFTNLSLQSGLMPVLYNRTPPESVYF